MQSDNRFVTRYTLTTQYVTKEQSMTSRSPNAEGKGITRPGLTGSLLRNC